MSLHVGSQRELVSTTLVIIAGGVVIAGLILGRSFLVPVVIAFILANVIGAIVERLEHLLIPSFIANILGVGTIAIALSGISWILSSQVDAVGEAWPTYVASFEALTDKLSVWLGAPAANQLKEAIQEINVRDSIPSMVGSAGGVLLTSALVLIYVIFLLSEKGLFTRKLVSFAEKQGQGEVLRDILHSVSSGVRLYLWIKTIISLITAGLSYLIFRILGLDFPEVWALLVFLLNYLPNVGSTLSVIFPAVLALLQFDTIEPFLIIAVLLTVVQLTIGNVIEPIFMGRSLDLSPFVIILALTFWTTIWGIAGAFLSVPITVAILILCKSIPAWQSIAVLLSRDGQLRDT